MELNLFSAILDLFTKLVEFFKSWPKWLKITTAIFVVLALPLGGFWLGVRYMIRPTLLGGIDLVKYCKSHDFETNNRDRCSSRVDLIKACNWQYDRSDLTFGFTSIDPNSGRCSDPSGKVLGGIGDMRGYCRSVFRPNDTVDAVLSGRDWECQSTVSPGAACNWQYQRDDLEAREEKGNLYCYH
jgi:hypothetical protein